jgi:indoleamine 2,3-dioxygenase
MSPHKILTLPSPLALGSYGISHNGFLPAESPCRYLSDKYYKPWEDIAACLPDLIKTLRTRSQMDKLPNLSTKCLKDESEWQRTFLLLSAFAQAYIWAGEMPAEVCCEKYSKIVVGVLTLRRSDYHQRSVFLC